ncbi:MAG TPA: GIDE domain-containing protein [Steroidobacteraceae bacterium]|nr:GIDE domain-containing protein [Steroidobacteraceae bacterium]
MDQALHPYYLALLLFGSAGISAGLYMFFRRWRQQRLLEDTPTAHIRSAPQGYVKLSGCARSVDGKSLRAPLTGRSCVWWSYRIEERGSYARAANRLLNINRGTSDQPFLLIEQGDHCLVDPDGAEIEPSDRKVWYGNSPDDIPPPRWGGSAMGFGHSYRYVEAILTEDAELSVLGEFRADTRVVTNTIADEAAALLSRWKQNQPALLARFDVNHDGRIDAAEWEAARAAALVEAQRNKLQQAPEARVCVLARPRGHQPFLIAAQSAGQLARTEGRRALAGLALTLLSLAVTCHAIAHIQGPATGR